MEKRAQAEPSIGTLARTWVGGAALCAFAYVLFLYGSGVEWPGFQPGESGALEISQDIILTLCLVLAIATACRTRGLPRAWVALFGVFVFLLLGEEISWGQQILHWTTTGWFAAHNYQHETNLHNTNAFYTDELPRRIVIAATLLGAGCYPLLRLFWRRELFGLPAWLMPGVGGVPIAFFIAVPTIVLHTPSLAPLTFDNDPFQLSELSEFYLYSTFLIYLIGLRGRLLGVRREA